MTSAAQHQNALAARVFLAAITLYFLGQFVLRITLGGALETDESEMMVMTPGLRLGYGPQLPLYNWFQVVVFEVFGRSLIALSLLKNTVLWSTYLFLFLGFRLWMPPFLAAAAALSLFLIPDVMWEAQRSTTHSNMMLATTTATVAAFLWVLRSGRLTAFVVLGVAMGLGGLAKYNYWLVPVGLWLAAASMAQFRVHTANWRMLFAMGLSALIVAAPYAWMASNSAVSMASTGKLHMDSSGGVLQAVLNVTTELLPAALLIIAPSALIIGLGWLAVRRAPLPDTSGGAVAVSVLLGRAALIVLVLMCAGMALSGISRITPRWLLPLVMLAVPAMAIPVAARANRSVIRAYAGVFLFMVVLVFSGLTYDRYKDGARRDVVFDTLPEKIAGLIDPMQTPVVVEFYTAGNLAWLRPEWNVMPYLPNIAGEYSGQTVLFLLRETKPPSFESAISRAGWPKDAQVNILDDGMWHFPFGKSTRTLPVRYVLAEMP